MKIVKKSIPIFLLILGIFLLNFISSYRLEVSAAAKQLDLSLLTKMHILSILNCFLLGLMVEWKLISAFIEKQAKMQFSMEFILGIILLVLSLTPAYIVLTFARELMLPFPKDPIGLNMLCAPLMHGNGIQLMLGGISAILITRGLIKR